MADRVHSTLETHPWLVCTHDDRVLGYAYATRHRARHAYQWSTEVSVYVDAAAHRRGVARLLYESLFDVLRRQGFANVYAGITLPNAASVAFHHALGFEPIGTYRRVGYKNGNWHDVVWLGLRLESAPSSAPAPPIPFPELTDDVDWSGYRRGE